MALANLAALSLKTLFCDDRMFTSRQAWGAAGFRVLDRSDNRKIMVASHPSVSGFLFKKYSDAMGQKDQLANYNRRVAGADQLRDLVNNRSLLHVAVPRKQIIKLPYPRSYILVVEQFNLLNDEQTRAAYRDIDPGILRELCLVLFHFRGMDSSAKNIPITADGRIAFIDTEHWDRGSNKDYLYQISSYLSADRRKLAGKIFDQLDDGEEHRRSRIEGGVKFFDDEDTSSSSS